MPSKPLLSSNFLLFKIVKLLSFIFLFVDYSLATQSPLNYNDLLDLVLKNNSSVQLALLDYKISLAEEQAAHLDLDYNISLGVFTEEKKKEPNSKLDNDITDEKTMGLSGGLKNDLSSGLKLETSLQALKITSTSKLAVAAKRYQTAALIKCNLPILKGRGEDIKINKLKKAEFKTLRYEQEFAQTISDELLETYNLFLDISKTHEDLLIRQLALKNQEEIHDFTLKESQLGKKSQIDVLVTKAAVWKQLAKIEEIKNTLFDLNLKLEKNIGPVPQGSATDNFIMKKEFYPLTGQVELPNAKKRRDPEQHSSLRSLEYQIQESSVDVRKAENSLLPQLDLDMEIKGAGLGKDLDNGISDVTDWKYPSYEVVLTLKFPLENFLGKGSFQEEQAQNRKLQVQKEKAYLKLTSDIEKNQRELEILTDKLNSLKRRLEIQQQQLIIKKELYKFGRISILELSEAIYDLEDLTLTKMEVSTSLHKQKLEMAKNLGTLVPENRIAEALQ